MTPELRFAALLFLLLNFSPCFAGYVAINGSIKQAHAETINFFLWEQGLNGERTKYVAKIGGENNFEVGLDIQREQIVLVEYGEAQFELFLSPNDQKINIQFDASNVLPSLSFNGDRSDENNFLNFFRLNYSKRGKPTVFKEGGFITTFDQEMVRRAKAYSAEDYFGLIQSQYQTQLHYLHNQPNLNRVLFKYIEKEIRWTYETNKIAFILYNRDRLSLGDLRGYWVRYGFLQTVDINDDHSVSFPVYQNLLQAFIHYLYCETPVRSPDLGLEYYRFIERNLSGRSRFFMLGKLMIDNYRHFGNSDLILKVHKNFQRNNPYNEYTHIINEIFGAELEYLNREMVPGFTVKGEQGQKIELQDFSGKVVYVSFWASWCAPCLQGFRDSKTVRNKLRENGVVFLNVNLDKSEAIWKNTLQREHITGTNTFAIDLETLKTKFNINSLPFYLCVDKAGNRSYLSSENLNQAQYDLMELNNK